jgi:hypothetical protein
VCELRAQAAMASDALWVAPGSPGQLEDAVVRTVTSTLLSSRGIDPATDLQARCN